MATPYFQLRLERVPSTQDVARERLAELPLLVMAGEQSEGRGRSGAGWMTADRALAASGISEIGIVVGTVVTKDGALVLWDDGRRAAC